MIEVYRLKNQFMTLKKRQIPTSTLHNNNDKKHFGKASKIISQYVTY